MAVVALKDDSFSQDTKEGLVLVDFWAEWCGPCRMVAPIVEELSSEMPQVKFAKVNVDENQRIAQTLGITAIPTLVLYKDGQPVDRVVGLLPKPQLKNFINKHV
ncbi:MAG TPA: thioredoxin [Leptospiraceae bacterium]|jgi:thioredoxin 1|nr:thioredoxin [Leptospirales bacterium]HMU85098.1 thioredoxin [Leptospiraceae bacterium]HMW60510.1 thioredoxin [Leptospiraceae bacterium]HMX56656.1 thioredoxin [Leptospiraceae bacterium]HMY45518.1 thioredoxin [Leptospiraceae bacterium]